MNVNDMADVAQTVTDVLKVLAHPSRLMALCSLVEGELSVGELAKRVGARDQAMSQQLSVLRAHGFVAPRRDGQTIYYAIARDDVRRILETLYAEYCGAAADASSTEQPAVTAEARR